MNLSLIPFGLQVETGEFVDVSQVPNGKKCGCICPSCKMPFIARQGEVNEWHFAHATKTGHEQTKQACEFSFYVSVRMMAKQVISSIREINSPALKGHVSRSERGYIPIRKEFTVTEEKVISFDEVQADVGIKEIKVDLVLNVGGVQIFVYFTHPKRPLPHELQEIRTGKFGILEISLQDSYELLYSSNKNKTTFYDALQSLLINETKNKRWVYHPRYKGSKQKVQEELQNTALEAEPPDEFSIQMNRIISGAKRKNLQRRIQNKADPSPAEKMKESIRLEWLSYKAEFSRKYGHSPSDEEIRIHNPDLYEKKKNYHLIK